eukprot:COSAG06_NODE_19337_length_843_cov_0.922043_2_plen_63_part_01
MNGQHNAQCTHMQQQPQPPQQQQSAELLAGGGESHARWCLPTCSGDKPIDSDILRLTLPSVSV